LRECGLLALSQNPNGGRDLVELFRCRYTPPGPSYGRRNATTFLSSEVSSRSDGCQSAMGLNSTPAKGPGAAGEKEITAERSRSATTSEGGLHLERRFDLVAVADPGVNGDVVIEEKYRRTPR